MRIYQIVNFIIYPFLVMVMRVAYRRKLPLFHERIGRATRDRPKGEIVWVHAEKIENMRYVVSEIRNIMPEKIVLVTYCTNSGVPLPENDNKVIVQRSAVDSYFPVRNFLKFWEPSVAIFVGSEIHPMHLAMAKKYEIPMFLVNAEIPEKTYKMWKAFIRLARKSTKNFDFVWAVNNREVLKFANLGASNIMSMEQIDSPKLRHILHKIKQLA